jgi:hypothetical protein
LALAVQIARQDLVFARSNADPRWLGRAEAVLAPWPLQADAPPETILLRATILQSNHEFAASIGALDMILAREPGNAQARLVRAAVLTVGARYRPALEDCAAVAIRYLGLAPDSCTASVMAMMGAAPQAMRAVTLSLAQNPGELGPVRLWATTLAAEIAARLDDSSAESRFAQALAIGANDPYLLGAWTDWLLDHSRAAEVVPLLSHLTRIDPLLLRLAIAETGLGLSQAAGHVADLSARFEAARLRGDTVHRREEARFSLVLLHDPARALQLARANWEVQREPADARILLESAIAARDPGAAAPVLSWIAENHVQDTTLAALAERISNRS